MALADTFEKDVIEFTRELVRIRSYSDEEGGVARAVVAKMKELTRSDSSGTAKSSSTSTRTWTT